MSTMVVQSFGVENPDERADELRRQLPLSDAAGVVSTRPETDDGTTASADVRYDVLVLSASVRIESDHLSKGHWRRTSDVLVYGPYMDGVLRPGERGFVLAVNDTAMVGTGHVYEKRADGDVVVGEKVGDGEEGLYGRGAADAVAERYGFRPYWGERSDVVARLADRGDPYVRYRSVEDLEPGLDHEMYVVDDTVGPCRNCGATLEENRYQDRNVLTTDYQCPDCEEYYTHHDPRTLPDPSDRCPECGGEFRERDLQYPEMASTAYGCRGCGFVTFDTHGLSASEIAAGRGGPREAVVGPAREARVRKARRSDPPDFESLAEARSVYGSG